MRHEVILFAVVVTWNTILHCFVIRMRVILPFNYTPEIQLKVKVKPDVFKAFLLYGVNNQIVCIFSTALCIQYYPVYSVLRLILEVSVSYIMTNDRPVAETST